MVIRKIIILTLTFFGCGLTVFLLINNYKYIM